MSKITVSAKVTPEIAKEINETGYTISDVMIVGLQMFLQLPRKEQESLIWGHLQRKKRERALGRYPARNI